MKDPMKAVERFCYNHPRFGIPNLMRWICIGSAAVWILCLVNSQAYYFLLFSPSLVMQGEVWRILSFFFLPESTGTFAVINILLYYWIGSTLESHWGTGQFTIYFFTGYVLTMIFSFVMWLAFGYDMFVTPFYVYLSMFFAFATFFPDAQINLYFLFPIKIKYLALIGFIYYVGQGLLSGFPYYLLPVVGLMNYMIFCGGELLHRIRGNKTSKTAADFRRETRRIRYEQSQQLYHHKCAVCGRTDTEYPELEFRYCSRCQGYHCFCQDHINNHIHFTE